MDASFARLSAICCFLIILSSTKIVQCMEKNEHHETKQASDSIYEISAYCSGVEQENSEQRSDSIHVISSSSPQSEQETSEEKLERYKVELKTGIEIISRLRRMISVRPFLTTEEHLRRGEALEKKKQFESVIKIARVVKLLEAADQILKISMTMMNDRSDTFCPALELLNQAKEIIKKSLSILNEQDELVLVVIDQSLWDQSEYLHDEVREVPTYPAPAPQRPPTNNNGTSSQNSGRSSTNFIATALGNSDFSQVSFSSGESSGENHG